VTSVVVQPSGRIVVAGSNSLVGLTPEGALDRTFGHGGSLPVAKGGSLSGVVRGGRGRMVGFGAVRGNVAVFRYRRNGAPDRSFGTRGRFISRLRQWAQGAEAGAIQPDGKIVVAGSFYRPGHAPNAPPFSLLRLKRGGSLDRSFGRRGHVVSLIHGRVASVAVAGPRIIVAGTGGGEFRAARFER
jgi:uncharacterized delta-60 repeat protein